MSALWLVGNVGSVSSSSVRGAIILANLNLSPDFVDCIILRFATSNVLRIPEPKSFKYDVVLRNYCSWLSFHGFAYRVQLASLGALLLTKLIISGRL